MAKLYYRYSTMNAGKSLDLLKVAYNYTERGCHVLLFTSHLDDRYGQGKISSRAGLQKEAMIFNRTMNLYAVISSYIHESDIQYPLDCILIDEAQFLTKEQVKQLSDIVDYLNIPIICYGLRTDFRGELFEGSMWLLAWSDSIEEIKTICWCGKKTIMNTRIEDGKVVYDGEQIIIGGNEKYIALCRKHYKLGKYKEDKVNV